MIDILIIVILLLFMLMGYKKGLVREGLSLISNIISIILAVIAYPVMNMLLKAVGVQKWLEEQISQIHFISKLDALVEVLGENIALGIMSLLAIVLLWIIIKIIVTATLRLVSSVVESLPIVAGLNRLAGLVLGFLKGVLILSIITLLIPVIMVSDLEIVQQLQLYINDSQILPILYQYNLALWLVQTFINSI